MCDKKQPIPARFSEPNIAHIDALGSKHFPALKRSTVLDMIVTEHRMLHEAQILTASGSGPQDVLSLQGIRILLFDLLLQREAEKQKEAA